MTAPRDHAPGAFLRRSEQLLKWASHALMWLASLLVAAMLVQMIADVVLKYAFNSPIPMTAEMVANYYMVAVVFLPLPLVEFNNASVSVDLFYRMFGAAYRRVLMLLAYLGQLFFFGILSYQSFLDALEATQVRKFVYTDFRLEIWAGTYFLPLGFALATLVCVLRIQQILARSDWEQVVEHRTLDELPAEKP